MKYAHPYLGWKMDGEKLNLNQVINRIHFEMKSEEYYNKIR